MQAGRMHKGGSPRNARTAAGYLRVVIETLETMPAGTLGFRATGELTADDYRDVLVPVSVIPTGSISIDAALGVGGFPRGRVIEVYGPESGGKTTLTLHVIAEAQRLGGIAAFIGTGVSPLIFERLAQSLAMKLQDLVSDILNQFEHGECLFRRPETGDLDGDWTRMRGRCRALHPAHDLPPRRCRDFCSVRSRASLSR